MEHELNILFIEDLPTDQELAERQLKSNSIQFKSLRVDSREGLLQALETFRPDLIISDYAMPGFDGMQALLLVKELRPEIPFVVLTGSMNEDTAVECMKAGAADYVIKEHINRLPFAVREALQRAKDRQEKIITEMQLLQSEEKFRYIFQAANVGKTITTATETISVNDSFSEMLGYTKDELVKIPWENITHPDDYALTRDQIAVVHKEEIDSVRYEKRFLHKDGHTVWVDISVKTHRTTDGKVEYFFSTIIDISEKKKSEEKLRASEEQFRLLIENQSDMIVKIDAEGRFLYVSPSYCNKFGKTEAELLGEKFAPLVHEEDLPATLEAIESLIQPPHSGYIEQRAMTKDGWRWISWTDTAILDDKGNIKEIIGLGIDITTRKEAENQLRKSEEKFRSLFQDNRSIMLLIDPRTGKIIDANPTACKYYGYEPDSLLNINISQINSLPQEELFEAMRKAVNGEKNAFQFQHRLANGDIRDVEVNSSPIEHQGSMLLLSIVNDITKRKQAEKAFKQLNELLNLFIHNSPIYAFIKEVTESTNTVIIASENYSDMIGIPGSQMAGKTMLELFPAEFAEKFMADDWEVVKSGQVLKLEEEMDGKFYASIKFPILQGEKTLLAGYTIDLTERKQAEKALEQKVDELMRFHNLTVDRELKMVELKKEVNQLLHDAGKPRRYKIED